jgi:hypothetical protein
VSITIDKIGLKDAQSYIGCYMTVSVADSAGAVLETQDTPKSTALKPNYVTFGHTAHIQTTFEEVDRGSLVVFFEFKHYKPQKKKISTRCFAFMEAKELAKAKGNPVVLELYAKPTDLTRKSLALFTIKQLYLHVTVAFTMH